uniref:PLL-like beta propeller domain-containing protein n=1 Tax=Pyricularia oryzae (strain P131) TaxID=1143193 RepID=L7IYR5_PYRO1
MEVTSSATVLPKEDKTFGSGLSLLGVDRPHNHVNAPEAIANAPSNRWSSIPTGLEVYQAAEVPEKEIIARGYCARSTLDNGTSYPEVVSGPSPVPTQYTSSFSAKKDKSPEPEKQSSLKFPWWRQRRRMIIAVAVAGFIVIATAVGVGVGVHVSRSQQHSELQPISPSNGDDEAVKPEIPTGKSICANAPCLEALAAVVDAPDAHPEQATVHLFARRRADGMLVQTSSASPGVYHSRNWTERGGPIAGPGPSAIIWQAPTYPNEGGAGTAGAPISFKYRIEMLGVPATCAIQQEQRFDFWVQARNGSDADGSATLYHQLSANGAWFYDGRWETDVVLQTSPSRPAAIASRPGLLCRNGRWKAWEQHLVVYDGDGAAWHRQWMQEPGPSQWGPWESLGGKYAKGTYPVLVETTAGSFQFFGLGSDEQMYSMTWTSAQGFGNRTTLGGGAFASVPAVAVSQGSGSERVDVVAVSKDDGRLKHKAIGLGVSMDEQWEDLGIVSNSAPTLAKVGLASMDIFTTAVDGSIWYAPARLSDMGRSGWGNLTWAPIQGL